VQDRLPLWITTMAKANTALGAFIADYNARFAIRPETAESAFEPLSSDFDLDTLLAVQFKRTTDNRGCFSFRNLLFLLDARKGTAQKKIRFLFSERIGFKVFYNHEYSPVRFLGAANSRTNTHLPDVTRLVLEKYYLQDGKPPNEALA
jgi:hypothetical protein